MLKLLSAALVAALSLTAFAENVQHAECFPSDPAAANWPVTAIYLHGLFSSSNNADPFVKLEASNRQELKALAEKLRAKHMKIAIPVSPQVSRGGQREWNSVSLKAIEKAAQAACHGVELAPERALIGFSNGAKKAGMIARGSCKEIKEYKVIFAIGSPSGHESGSCGNRLVNNTPNPHHLPPPPFLDKELAKDFPDRDQTDGAGDDGSLVK